MESSSDENHDSSPIPSQLNKSGQSNSNILNKYRHSLAKIDLKKVKDLNQKKKIYQEAVGFSAIGSLQEEQDKIINEVIDEIWNTYNCYGHEYLDKKEMEQFVWVTLIENGHRDYKSIDDLRADPKFQAVFDLFDEDGSGQIEKNELYEFIKKVSGL